MTTARAHRMQTLLLNALVFGSFYLVALLWHCVQGGKAPTTNQHIGYSVFAFFASHTHHLMPAFNEAAREFVAHFIVYSGHVIPQH
jgi:hypothetical protein